MNLLRDGEVLALCTPLVDERVSGRFGADYGGYQHRGDDSVDAHGRLRQPVRATVAGVVCEFLNSEVWFNGQKVRSFGNGVCIDAGVGRWRYTLLGHLDVAYFNIGEEVQADTVVGLMGATGVAYGAHVHWQRSESSWFPVDIGRSVDPRAYLATEEEKMEPYRWKLMQAADGPSPDMDATFEFLKPLGYFTKWFERDGDPDGNADPSWRAMARRECLRWVAAGPAAQDAVKALGWA